MEDSRQFHQLMFTEGKACTALHSGLRTCIFGKKQCEYNIGDIICPIVVNIKGNVVSNNPLSYDLFEIIDIQQNIVDAEEAEDVPVLADGYVVLSVHKLDTCIEKDTVESLE